MSKKYTNNYRNKYTNKYNTEYCNNSMTFQDCELAILRHAVDENEKVQNEKVYNSEEIKTMISIVENFIKDKQLICYGGTAINNILPTYDQFYDKDIEIPDYDFYSINALDHAKELANIYYKLGYLDVEAKSGIHPGTYKVFVNFIPIADITFLDNTIYNSIKKDSIVIAGIKYAPPNFLRMNMYLELSRPYGDVSRWEKVLKRLNLLNKHYPLESGLKCNIMKTYKNQDIPTKLRLAINKTTIIYNVIKDSFIEQGVVFFGSFSTRLYSKYNKKKSNNIIKFMYEDIREFDVLSETPELTAEIVIKKLKYNNIQHITKIVHPQIGELIPENIEIQISNETVAYIYKPIACHNYNTITLNNVKINIATIDTMLSFYLAFIYINKPYYAKDRILCIAKMLFDIEQQNKLSQYGILKRFRMNCIGKQSTLENIRSEKAEKYKELMHKKGTREYETWFLKYNPNEQNMKLHKKHLDKIKSNTLSKDLNTVDNWYITKPLKQNKTRKLIRRLKKKQSVKNNKLSKSSSFLF